MVSVLLTASAKAFSWVNAFNMVLKSNRHSSDPNKNVLGGILTHTSLVINGIYEDRLKLMLPRINGYAMCMWVVS